MSEVGWSEIAEWYDEHLRSGRTPHTVAADTVLALAGDVRGRRVLDVGCGQGSATRALARAGALVTGTDSSSEMLAAARRHEDEQPLGIDYLRADGQDLSPLADESFDLVTCQLALMDIPDLDAVLVAVRRVLRPGGAFVAVISHPCFLAPFAQTVSLPDGRPARVVHEYLREQFWRSTNPEGVRRAGTYHRTISTYVNALTRHGFALEEAMEPPASGEHAEQSPVYRQVPIFFGFRAAHSGW